MKPRSQNRVFPGTTEAVVRFIAEGRGNPVTSRTIRKRFDVHGWLTTSEGKDRSQTIYETLRRLTKQARVVKQGKGYVLTPKGQEVLKV